jgi:hypothetical protein
MMRFPVFSGFGGVLRMSKARRPKDKQIHSLPGFSMTGLASHGAILSRRLLDGTMPLAIAPPLRPFCPSASLRSLGHPLSAHCPDNADRCPRTNLPNRLISGKWRSHAVFWRKTGLAQALLPLPRKPHKPTLRRTAMKFETLMLNSFFAACVVLCVSTLTAMLA